MKFFRIRGVVLMGAMSLVFLACGTESVEDQETAPPSSEAASAETTVATTTPPTTQAPSTTTVVESTSTSQALADAEVVPLESVVGGTIRGEGWLVEPGNYSTEFGPNRYTFVITEPVVYFPSDARITFGPDTSSSVDDMFLLASFAGVIPAEKAGEHAPHDPRVPAYTAPAPENLGTWLSSVSQLTPGDQLEIATDMGISARAWDVVVAGPGDTFHCPFGASCVSALVNEAEGVYVFFENSAFRVWQFTGADSGLFGFLQSRSNTFTDMVGIADMIIGGMTVEETS